MILEVKSLDEMLKFGKLLGHNLYGGMVVELVGDVGAGKTTLTKGLAEGLEIDEEIQSPTFTINRQYPVSQKGYKGSISNLVHYDFYRLHDAGIMSMELDEAISSPANVIVVEWAEIIEDALPADRLTIKITFISEEGRRLEIIAGGPKSQKVIDRIEEK